MKTLGDYSKQYGIPYSTLWARINAQGMTIKQAVKARDKRGAIYHVLHADKHITDLCGATAVANWLSKRLRAHITKAMIIGRMYRKRNKTITVDKYTIIREW